MTLEASVHRFGDDRHGHFVAADVAIATGNRTGRCRFLAAVALDMPAATATFYRHLFGELHALPAEIDDEDVAGQMRPFARAVPTGRRG